MHLQIFTKLSKQELPFASACSNTEIPRESQTKYPPNSEQAHVIFRERSRNSSAKDVGYSMEDVKKGIYLFLQVASQ